MRMRAATLNFLLILSFGSFASATSAQDNQPQSLGDVARQTRGQNLPLPNHQQSSPTTTSPNQIIRAP